MITVGNDQVNELFNGNMGIKNVYIGEDLIYKRESSFVYIELTSATIKEENE